MMNWYDSTGMQMGHVLSEDVNAPELRNLRYSTMHTDGWLTQLIKKIFK